MFVVTRPLSEIVGRLCQLPGFEMKIPEAQIPRKQFGLGNDECTAYYYELRGPKRWRKPLYPPNL